MVRNEGAGLLGFRIPLDWRLGDHARWLYLKASGCRRGLIGEGGGDSTARSHGPDGRHSEHAV